jgi:flagellin
MSLGVLNNLSAVYAENALNSTNNSLSTTLQQLSTGSKINSGADDAAGLSLVNGLEANQTALTQSQTNATEGVGLLQVADGALSQVTSLLNRAVTLATEASNGTLNSTQDAAANQEYQSILSEIDNIGSTTTYNQEAVFGGNYGIYTGDSTKAGSSIDDLNIGSLSSSTVGQTDGTMSYGNGANAFFDLTGSSAAGSGDTLKNADAVSITYETSAGTQVAATFTVSTANSGSITESVGGNNVATVNGDSVQAMIQAINGSGIGVTATFATASEAGDATAAAATDGGIEIAGDVVGSAVGSLTAPGDVVVLAASSLTDSADGAAAAAPSIDSSPDSTATIGYSAIGGENLSNTDLLTTSDSQTSLTDLNAAISDVAAQDGYVGAQINTLNAASSVLSTQSENIQSAQNAVQATDYAAASSNMSKFEILSQTGIAALAQANSMQQEVTKLLQ